MCRPFASPRWKSDRVVSGGAGFDMHQMVSSSLARKTENH